MEYGILGLIVLILDIYAVIKILGSGASTGAKVLWTLGILIFPVIGAAWKRSGNLILKQICAGGCIFFWNQTYPALFTDRRHGA